MPSYQVDYLQDEVMHNHKASTDLIGGHVIDVGSGEEAITIQDGSIKKLTAKWTEGAITLDVLSEEPENKISNPSFTSDVSGWSCEAETGTSITNANGEWVLVPGDATYGTSDFYVMKYEAKYDANGDGDGDTPAEANVAGACTGATGCTADVGSGLDYRDIVGFNKEKVVSTANGAPLVHITQTQALSACPAGSHLISNAEWMTIVRNAEAQAANWANNTPNSTVVSGGGLKRGNVGVTDSASYNGADPEQGTGRNTKAKLALSNGAELWDLSGNVWEWNSDTIMGADKPHNNTAAWAEWTDFTPPGASTYGTLSYDLTRPASSSLNSDYGIGKYYQGPNTAGPYAFGRGGYWGNTSDAGAFALDLFSIPSSQYNSVGFRCASDPVAISQSFSSSVGRAATGANSISVGSVADGKIYQAVNVGDTSTYYFSAYVYNNTAGSVGGVVDSNVATLYYGGNTINNPVYTAVVGETGWYLLTGTVTGVASNTDTGLVVKKGKKVIVDDVSLQAGVAPTTQFNIINSGSGSVNQFIEGGLGIKNEVDADQTQVIGASSGQTANLTEWQDSLGNVLSAFEAGGAIKLPITSKSADFTATNTNHSILVTCSTVNITITLPAVSGTTGRIYNIKKMDSTAYSVIIDGNASETIDGETTQTLSSQYDSIAIQSTGSAWVIL